MWWSAARIDVEPAAANQEAERDTRSPSIGWERPAKSVPLVKRSRHERPNRYPCFPLTDAQQAANRILRQIGPHAEPDELCGDRPWEVQRLIADIQNLESIIRRQNAQQRTQTAALERVQSEALRWLAETEALSARLRSINLDRRNLAENLQRTQAELARARENVVANYLQNVTNRTPVPESKPAPLPAVRKTA